MLRLVTFGCSYTVGVGLPDTWPDRKNEISKLSWPYRLGQLLSLDVDNQAVAGSGNAEIFNKILNYNFQPTDLVVIMWSHFIRYDDFKVSKNYETHRVWGTFLKNYRSENLLDLVYMNAYENYLTFQHASLLLRSKNIKSIAFLGHPKDKDDFPCPSFINIENLVEIDKFTIDMALDKEHFGEQSHKKLASLLHKVCQD